MQDETGSFYRLKLKLGKTNPLNLPQHKSIVPSDRLCAYSLTKKYLKKLSPTSSLVPRCHPKDPKVAHPTKGVPYSTALSDLKEVMTMLGYDGDEYSEHSMKRY